MSGKWLSRVASVSVVLGIAGLAAAAVHHHAASPRVTPSSVPPTQANTYVAAPIVSQGTRDELVVVLIASSHCAGSMRQDFVPTVLAMKRALAARAQREGKRLITVGAALDDSQKAGLDFLGTIGPFDEEIIGGNWLNDAAIQYMWRDQPGTPSVPQWILLERHVEIGQHAIHVSDEKVVARIIGDNAMLDWLKTNAHRS